MSDHDSDLTRATGLPRHVVRLAERRARIVEDFVILPTQAKCNAIARDLGIPGLRKLRFVGRLSPADRRDWALEARLGATVEQDCVVTLAPVVTRIDEIVLRRYIANLPAPGPGEIEMPEDDSIEPLPASLDLCGVMIEALSLALPAFPRAPGAELGEITLTEEGVATPGATAVRPFAELSALRTKLAVHGPDSSNDKEPGSVIPRGKDPAEGGS
jgi:hypothetical protein